MNILPEGKYIALYLAILDGHALDEIINSLSPNATVCPRCNCDDFTHSEGCKIAKQAEKMLDAIWSLRRKQLEKDYASGNL